MAADDFALKPIWMEPKQIGFSNIITQSESNKKEYLNVSTTSVDIYTCTFVLSDTDYATFLSHWNGRYGGFDLFSFIGVPAYISGSPITGRWVDKSFKPKPKAGATWDVSVDFEKDNG